ncbi:GrpE-domain-containing protein [Pseudoneurospora amorphoporcata]|uniref:GrpE protein homolog n=1 Tax=Pseudoneurospora amorphoporcata TaxID=241081 RepID=A0AAN6NZ84_9PEZI|nr:GrpE-domain-containing protein [Pseudoneurospora amorphoporcata]
MLRTALTRSSRALCSGTRVAAQRPIASQMFQMQAARTAAPQLRSAARWYSAEAEGEKKAEEGAEKKEGEADDVVAALKQQLDAKDAEAREWKDKCLRTVADFRNLQERTARDVKQAKDFAIQKFAKDLVESVDNFDRALSVVPQEKLKSEEQSEHLKDLVNLYEGLKMTETILLQTLKKHGLERIDPDGEVFNPNEHEATFMAPMPDKEHNTVFHIQQKGFKLNGRVLRPAQVGVVKNK